MGEWRVRRVYDGYKQRRNNERFIENIWDRKRGSEQERERKNFERERGKTKKERDKDINMMRERVKENLEQEFLENVWFGLPL